MRKTFAVALVTVALGIPATLAIADTVETDTPTTTTTVVELSPPTTSAYGTQSEIVIALDDNGDIVPSAP